MNGQDNINNNDDTSAQDIDALVDKSQNASLEGGDSASQGNSGASNQDTPGQAQGDTNGENADLQKKKEEVFDWLKDKRAEKMWGKDPNNMYKALKNLEKVSTPTHMAMKKYGVEDSEGLEKILEAYKNLSNPEAPANVITKEIETWLSAEGLKDKVTEFFNQMRVEFKKQEATKLFGYQINNEQLTPQMIKLMEEHEQLKNTVSKYEQEQQAKAREQALDNSLNSIKEMAKEYGIEDYDENAFLQEVLDQKIPLAQLESYFLRNALSKVAEISKQRGENTVLNNLKKKKFSGVVPQGGTPSGEKDDVEAEFNSILDKITT